MDGEAPAAPENQPQPDPAVVEGGVPIEGAPAGGLKFGEDGVPLEEEKKDEDIIPSEVQQQMENVWNVFDLQRTHSVEIKHLRTIMRALDFNLEPEELEITRKQIDPDNTGFITYARLKLVMEDKLKDTDTPEDMLAFLKHLDRDNDGRIPVPEFKQYMANMGSKMTTEQVEDLMKEVDTAGDGFIYIDDLS